MRRLTRVQARRAAVRASGLDQTRPDRVDVRHFRRVARTLDVVQLDSVNVLARAHELVFFSRLGAYDTEHLRRWLWLSREMVEGWVHAASMVPMEAEPLQRFRHAARLERPGGWIRDVHRQFPGYAEQVLAEVAEHGPVTTSELADAGDRSEGMWGWSPGRKALHHLFATGRLAIHQRTRGFVPEYATRDHVVPAEVRAREAVPAPEAHEQLVRRAARAQGWGTAKSLRDHHRLPYLADTRAAIERLAARSELVEVDVEGVGARTWADVDMVVPRSVRARALVCPFDPLVWFRDRVESLWDMRYRIEIYTPEPEREFGYYTLPFLLDERLVGRVDLKADRQRSRLVVRGAWAEPDVDHDRVARGVRAELLELAEWQGLVDIEVEPHGDLAPSLARTA